MTPCDDGRRAASEADQLALDGAAPHEMAPTPVASNPSALLAATDVSVRFGGIAALSNVDVAVPPASIIGLVGPNGAGKSTLFAVLSGLLRPNTGTVYLKGKDVSRSSPQARARRGLARTFQQPELYMGLTVREHLVLAYRVRHARSRLWKDMFLAGSLRRPDRAERDRVDNCSNSSCSLPSPTSWPTPCRSGRAAWSRWAGRWPSGPSVILLDEPLAGLDVHEAERLSAALRRTVSEEKVSLLLVEHDVGMVLSLSSHIYVLDFGIVIAAGAPDHVRTNPAVQAAYLGDEDVLAAGRMSTSQPTEAGG